MAISDNLRRIRREKGMTQQEFADAIGVSNNSVYLWERGVITPGMGSMMLIITKLGVDAKELFKEEKE